MTVPW